LFISSGLAAFPVIRDDRLIGIVSRADSIKLFGAKAGSRGPDFDAILGTTVEEIMSSPVIAIEPDATLAELLDLMGACEFDSFPVIDSENHVAGMIARADVIRALERSASRSSLPLDLRPVGYAIA
jgi:CBS domain-containing protein